MGAIPISAASTASTTSTPARDNLAIAPALVADMWGEVLYALDPYTPADFTAAMALCQTSRAIYVFRKSYLKGRLRICNGDFIAIKALPTEDDPVRLHGLVQVDLLQWQLYRCGRIVEELRWERHEGNAFAERYEYDVDDPENIDRKVSIEFNPKDLTVAKVWIAQDVYTDPSMTLEHMYLSDRYTWEVCKIVGGVMCISKADGYYYGDSEGAHIPIPDACERAEHALAHPPRLYSMHRVHPFWDVQAELAAYEKRQFWYEQERAEHERQRQVEREMRQIAGDPDWNEMLIDDILEWI
jgi:hypothetical protein